jgi:hypothetical protein
MNHARSRERCLPDRPRLVSCKLDSNVASDATLGVRTLRTGEDVSAGNLEKPSIYFRFGLSSRLFPVRFSNL